MGSTVMHADFLVGKDSISPRLKEIEKSVQNLGRMSAKGLTY